MTGSGKPDEVPALPRLQDGRKRGEWASIYPRAAQICIYIELAYLLALLFTALLIIGACAVAQVAPGEAASLQGILPEDLAPSVYVWPGVLAAGVIGGTLNALKWHYHCVAREIWHADRRVWRITSPILSGVLALFSVMLIRSDILSVLRPDVLSRFLSAIASGFLLGLFSDNLLAALQNVTNATLGTLRDVRSRNEQPNGED